jgi:hypothetical protein
MSKEKFLISFQNNMSICIKRLLEEVWNCDGFSVVSEYRNLSGKFNGIIDIAITDNNNSLISIEIEHKSSYEQAKKNIEKIKDWTHRSNYRSCGLIQIFNEDSNISRFQIDSLVEYAKTHEKQSMGFYYDFIFYKIDDYRKSREIAEELIFSMDFQARLWLLLGLSNMR